MKKALLLITLFAAFVSCSDDKNKITATPELEATGLKGAVHDIRYALYDVATDLEGNYIPRLRINDLKGWEEYPQLNTRQYYNSIGVQAYDNIIDSTSVMTHFRHDTETGRLIQKATYSDKMDTVFTNFTYNKAGLIELEQSPNHKIAYVYDEKNNLTSKSLNDTIVTSYTYNDKGELAEEIEKNTKQGTTLSSTKYLYSPEGAFEGKETTAFTGKDGAAVNSYFNSKNLLTKVATDKSTIEYQYNEDGLRTKKIAADGETDFTYTFDDEGNWTRCLMHFVPKDKKKKDAETRFMIVRTIVYHN